MRGVSFRGDIGLDDISFTDGPCTVSFDIRILSSVLTGGFELKKLSSKMLIVIGYTV